MNAQTLIARDFSRAAARYDAHAHLQRDVATRCSALVQNHLLPKLPDAPTLLDAGCGTGYLAADLPDASLIQLDIAEGMARQAMRHGQPTITADITALPLADDSLDLVHSSLCLQWVDALETGLSECARALRDGGYIIFSTLEMGSLYELATSFAHATNTPRTLPFRHHTTYLNALESTGFAPLHTEQNLIIEQHPTPRDVMKNLKAIGANSKHGEALTPKQLKAAESYYTQHCPHPQGGVTASYRVLTVIAQR